MADPLTSFFSQRKADGFKVVTDLPKFDLEGYISNYSGRTQIDRLLHIGKHSPPLAIEAFKLAIKLLKQTSDVPRYKFAVGYLAQISPHDLDAAQDEEWVERTSRKVASDTEKLEAELKSYKHNLIKESIRMGQEDLGNHLYNTGDLPGAFKAYSRMRDFCAAPKHVLDMSMHIILCSISQANYLSVQSHIVKIRNLSRTPEEEETLKPKLSVAMGLTNLAAGSFKEAAKNFLDTPSALGASYNKIISSNDVAIYGGLCALASMERPALKTEVLDNNDFRTFLELEPLMRRAISYFHTAKYSSCLSILEEYKNDYLLDIHLHKHIDKLYEMIRSKGIVQYFIPFSCVTLGSMAEAFATTEEVLERELVEMIGSGVLAGRIDTKNRLLTAKEMDIRSAVHKKTLAMAQEYERNARMRLMRMNIIRAGLEVKMPKGAQQGGGGGGGGYGGQGQPWGQKKDGFMERFHMG